MEVKLTKDIKLSLEVIRNFARRQGYSEADWMAGDAYVLRTLFWTLKLPPFHGAGRAEDSGRDILKWWTLSDRDLPAKCTAKYCATEFGAVERNARAIGRAIALLAESPNLAHEHMELMIRLEEILKPVSVSDKG